MVYFGEISDSCAAILGVVYFIREILNIVCFLIPIALIVMLCVDFLKGVISFDDGNKKVMNYVIKRIIYAVVIFLLPSVVFGLFNILDLDSSDSNSCWTYVGESSVQEVKEISEAKEKALENKTKDLQEKINSKVKEKQEITSQLTKIIKSKGESDEEDVKTSGKVTLNWNDLTKTSNLTVSELRKILNKNSASKSFAPYASTFIKVEKKYKVNVFFLIALEAHESGWMRSSASKDCNNLGGVKYTGKEGTSECKGHVYARYSSVNTFITEHAELLGKKYLTKGGSHYNGTSIESIKKEYCPESNCSSWVSDIKIIGNKLYKYAK